MKSIYMLAKEVAEVKDPAEMAKLFETKKWVAVNAISKPDGWYFIMLRIA